MPVNLKGRSFLTLKDFTPDEIRYMLNLAADLKAKKRAGIRGNLLAGKNIVLLFEKTSTRTRCAFEVAAYDEGAHVTFLDSKSSQMGKKETMVDTAKVLGRFFDGIEYRGYDQKVVEGLAANAGVPVWNGLTDVDHPTQALADILTLMENTKKPLNKCKLVFCGDTRNNVAYCLMYICAKLGMHYVGWGPKELAPAADVVEYCREVADYTHQHGLNMQVHVSETRLEHEECMVLPLHPPETENLVDELRHIRLRIKPRHRVVPQTLAQCRRLAVELADVLQRAINSTTSVQLHLELIGQAEIPDIAIYIEKSEHDLPWPRTTSSAKRMHHEEREMAQEFLALCLLQELCPLQESSSTLMRHGTRQNLQCIIIVTKAILPHLPTERKRSADDGTCAIHFQ